MSPPKTAAVAKTTEYINTFRMRLETGPFHLAW